MLIKQLVLRNYRVFNGTHVIDLAPKKRQTTIIRALSFCSAG